MHHVLRKYFKITSSGYLTTRRVANIIFMLLVMNMAACSLRELVAIRDNTADNQVDPSVVSTYNGAVALYRSSIGKVAYMAALYIYNTALMSDELRADKTGVVTADARVFAEDLQAEYGLNGALFMQISRARILTMQAVNALQRFPLTAQSRAYISELFALQGFTELLLAEGYCSGVPLGRAPLGGGYEYGPGLNTAELLQHAIMVFDSALTYGGDSLGVAVLAHVGQGRAWSNLGEHARAMAAVKDVNMGDYRLTYAPGIQALAFMTPDLYGSVYLEQREGGNGLAWLAPTASEQDPRVPVSTAIDATTGEPRFTAPPRSTRLTPQLGALVIASVTEARLLRAEALLQPPSHPAGAWLDTLNVLRRAVGLADTTDPGTEAARVDLLFRERAFWLYGTGHRQGDLRRLIRQYGRTVQTTYPTGLYATDPTNGVHRYEDIVTLDPGRGETEFNPLYDGCFTKEP